MNIGTDEKAGAAPAAEQQAAGKKPAARSRKPAQPPATGNRRQIPRKAEFILPVLMILIVAMVFIYLNQGLLRLEKDIAESKAESAVELGRIEARLGAALPDIRGIQARLDELRAEQAALGAQLSEAAALEAGVNSDYALAEIEHLLALAGHKLALAQDAAGALAALTAADKRLTGLALPGAEQARSELRADMARLGAIEQADLSGLGLYLSDLIERVDSLPPRETALFEPASAPAAPPPEGVRGFFTAVWRELKGLVIIRREAEAVRPPLLPEQIYFLRANIKLELANARLAVFNRDTGNLQASLTRIQNWLSDHFDMRDSAAANFNDTLTRMQSLELALPEMNMDSTLESVRALAGPRQNAADDRP